MTDNQTKLRYAEIYPDTKILEFDRHFDYKIPAGLQGILKTGNIVKIPLRNRIETGYVARIKNNSNVSQANLKYIEDAATDISLFNLSRLKLIYWMCAYYIQPFGKIARLFAPPLEEEKTFEFLKSPVKFLKHRIILSINKGALPFFEKKSVYPKYSNQKKIVEYISGYGRIEKKLLFEHKNFSRASLCSLVKSGIVIEEKIREIEFAENPISKKELHASFNHGFIRYSGAPNFLNKDITETSRFEGNSGIKKLKAVIERIKDDIKNKKFRGYLFRDFSYYERINIILALCNYCLEDLKKLLILTPESAGAQEIASFLDGRFEQKYCIYTSDKNTRDRYECWYDTAKSRYSLIMGTRSAVFLPFYNPDIIILDQEHDSSYKDSSIIRYNTQDVVLKLAGILKIPVLFFSDCPSVKNMYFFNSSKNHCLISGGKSPSKVNIMKKAVDLKKIDHFRDDLTITRELFGKIKEYSEKGFNCLIFASRRGMSSFITCKNCGFVPICPSCEISYAFHSDKRILMCHHCSKTGEFSGSCSRCGSKNIMYKNNGIENIEKKLEKRFPDMPVIRIDSDITGSSPHNIINKSIRNKSPAIFLGTRKILNGIPAETFALCAIIDFDSLMQMPDFHTNERTFQTLRKLESVLRKDINTHFIIQSFNTDYPVLNFYINDDYDKFYIMELAGRKELKYPPYLNIINIILSGKDEGCIIRDAGKLSGEIENLRNPEKIILGPAPCPYSKINMNHRWHLLVKTNDIIRFNIQFSKIIRSFNRDAGVKIITDVDPVWIL